MWNAETDIYEMVEDVFDSADTETNAPMASEAEAESVIDVIKEWCHEADIPVPDDVTAEKVMGIWNGLATAYEERQKQSEAERWDRFWNTKVVI